MVVVDTNRPRAVKAYYPVGFVSGVGKVYHNNFTKDFKPMITLPVSQRTTSGQGILSDARRHLTDLAEKGKQTLSKEASKEILDSAVKAGHSVLNDIQKGKDVKESIINASNQFAQDAIDTGKEKLKKSKVGETVIQSLNNLTPGPKNNIPVQQPDYQRILDDNNADAGDTVQEIQSGSGMKASQILRQKRLKELKSKKKETGGATFQTGGPAEGTKIYGLRNKAKTMPAQ